MAKFNSKSPTHPKVAVLQESHHSLYASECCPANIFRCFVNIGCTNAPVLQRDSWPYWVTMFLAADGVLPHKHVHCANEDQKRNICLDNVSSTWVCMLDCNSNCSYRFRRWNVHASEECKVLSFWIVIARLVDLKFLGVYLELATIQRFD